MSDLPTKEIFNAATQQIETAELRVDSNGDIVATFADGGFLKFPSKIVTTEYKEDAEAVTTAAPITAEHLDSLIAAHEEANTGQEIITPEMEAAALAERAAALQAIGVNPDDAEAVAAVSVEPAHQATEPEQATNGNTMPESDKTNAPQAPAATDTPGA